MRIRKAVIPAAGFGTRVLPATKSMPKEMFPIVDKPTIQYIVEEAVNSGITDILIITNRGKGVMEDHFDRSPELEDALEKSGKNEFLEIVKSISNLANITFIRQKEMKGLGHAVLKAKSFVGNEPFAVLFGDGVIYNQGTPAIKQLIDVYGEYGNGVLGVKRVPESEIHKYGSLKVENLHDNVFKCTDMVEKPQRKEDVLSLYSITDRVVLPPEIFDILENTKPGVGGEIQLTDAMREIAITQGMTAVEMEGKRFDMGNKFGILKANIEVGLDHPETKEQLKEYIKELANNLDDDKQIEEFTLEDFNYEHISENDRVEIIQKASDENKQKDFYEKFRKKVEEYIKSHPNTKYVNYVMMFPDLFHLTCKLFTDARVQAKYKICLGLAIAYCVSPIDFIPEFIPGGYTDDALILIKTLSDLISNVDNDIIREHWVGEENIIKVIGDISELASGFMKNNKLGNKLLKFKDFFKKK